MPIPTIGYAAMDSSGVLEPWKFEQRDVGPSDVHIRVVACGVCQTDVHMAKNAWDWRTTNYPIVPGHEVAGIVVAVGSQVTKVKPGDKAGVGIIIDSCRTCNLCQEHKEPYCNKVAFTNDRLIKDGQLTYGGYARDLVCEDKFVCRFPESLDLYSGSALLCAGITAYSPMKKFGMDKPGKKLGVIGLGGVGHMVVKFGVAFGLDVTVISRSESKRHEALGVLGAKKFLNSTQEANFTDAQDSLDFIVDTVPAHKDINAYLSLLAVDGVMVIVGIPDTPILEVIGLALITRRRVLSGSIVGSIEETEEMLKFCAEKNITAMIEKIPMSYINTAWERMLMGDVHYRFVMDVQETCSKSCKRVSF